MFFGLVACCILLSNDVLNGLIVVDGHKNGKNLSVYESFEIRNIHDPRFFRVKFSPEWWNFVHIVTDEGAPLLVIYTRSQRKT